MPLKKLDIPRKTAATLRKFASWDRCIKLEPSGRGVISYRKRTSLSDDCAVEVWTDIHPETEKIYNLKGLAYGLAHNERSNDDSYLDRISRHLRCKAVSSFTLSEHVLSTLKVGLEKNQKRTIILDRGYKKAVSVDYVRETAVAGIPDFMGDSYEIYLPLPLVRALPRAGYWVKLFERNFAIFEELGGEFTVYTSLAGLKKLS